MTIIKFQVYPHSVAKTFDCPSCGKKNRKRTFKAECTVNPFNKGEDGAPLSATQVRAQSKEKATRQAEEFMNAPLCTACERALSFTQRRDVYVARKAGA